MKKWEAYIISWPPIRLKHGVTYMYSGWLSKAACSEQSKKKHKLTQTVWFPNHLGGLGIRPTETFNKRHNVRRCKSEQPAVARNQTLFIRQLDNHHNSIPKRTAQMVQNASTTHPANLHYCTCSPFNLPASFCIANSVLFLLRLSLLMRVLRCLWLQMSRES